MLGFALLISVMTGIAFGIAPALQVSRTNLSDTLKEATRGSSTGAARHRMRQSLVVSEVALTIIVLVGAGLMIESVSKLMGEWIRDSPPNPF